MAHDVYVNYSHEDKLAADAVVTGLESRGIRCWVAPRDLTPGNSWGEAIIKAIGSGQIVVIILSGNSNRSSQVVREVERAVANNIIIIPFRIEKIDPTGAMAYFLSTEHWLDAVTPPLEKHIQKLINRILVNLRNTLQKPQAKFTEKSILKLVDTIEVQKGLSTGRIHFCVGDTTHASADQAVDVLVISAIRDCYWPDIGSVLGSLYDKGINVAEMAANKEVDLRGAFSCWLSKEISSPPEGIHFKRILCYEPEESANAGEKIGDIFRSIAPFMGGKDPITSAGTTLVAAGFSRRITQRESLELLVEAAVHWMSSGFPIENFMIICLPNQDVDELTQLFAELKSRYASMIPHRQVKFAYDYFISYSHKDSREVELFVDLLLEEKQDLNVFIDKKDLNPGSAWQQEIYEAIDDCQKVATFLSPTYIESKVCIEEFNIALCRHRESDEPLLKPIYLYSANLPTYMRLVQFYDCRESNREKLKQAASHLLQSV